MTLIQQALARIEEMEKRAEGATPGPWEPMGPDCWYGEDYTFDPQGAISEAQAKRNIAFAAHARTDLPDVLALVKALLQDFPVFATEQEAAALKAFTEAR